MDVTIITSEPDEVPARRIAKILERNGFFVATVTVKDRNGEVAWIWEAGDPV